MFIYGMFTNEGVRNPKTSQTKFIYFRHKSNVEYKKPARFFKRKTILKWVR